MRAKYENEPTSFFSLIKKINSELLIGQRREKACAHFLAKLITWHSDNESNFF